MKTLIVYYSFTQNNEKLARYVREALHCDIIKIETLKARTGLSILFDLMFNRKPVIKAMPCDLRQYDHIMFIAPIWAGRIAMPLTTFLINEKVNIRNYSFVTLCGGGNVGQKVKVQNQLTEITGKVPINVVELWISDLLPNEKKSTIRYVSGYRIDPVEFSQFDGKIREALQLVGLFAKKVKV